MLCMFCFCVVDSDVRVAMFPSVPLGVIALFFLTGGFRLWLFVRPEDIVGLSNNRVSQQQAPGILKRWYRNVPLARRWGSSSHPSVAVAVDAASLRPRSAHVCPCRMRAHTPSLFLLRSLSAPSACWGASWLVGRLLFWLDGSFGDLCLCFLVRHFRLDKSDSPMVLSSV